LQLQSNVRIELYCNDHPSLSQVSQILFLQQDVAKEQLDRV
jgi:hypothetical protein